MPSAIAIAGPLPPLAEVLVLTFSPGIFVHLCFLCRQSQFALHALLAALHAASLAELSLAAATAAATAYVAAPAFAAFSASTYVSASLSLSAAASASAFFQLYSPLALFIGHNTRPTRYKREQEQ